MIDLSELDFSDDPGLPIWRAEEDIGSAAFMRPFLLDTPC
jgi:hypothetical protein